MIAFLCGLCASAVKMYFESPAAEYQQAHTRIFKMMFDSPPGQAARLFQNAQQRMMNNWAALLQSAQETSTTDAQTLQSLLLIWRETVQRGIRALTQHGDPAAQDIAGKIFISQLNMLHFVDISARVWSQMSETIDSGDDWQPLLSDEMQQIRGEWVQLVRGLTHQTATPADRWQAFFEEGCAYSVLWPDALRRQVQQQAVPGGARAASQPHLHWQTTPHSFAQQLYAPTALQMQAILDAVQTSFRAWQTLQDALQAYHLLLIDTWLSAFRRLLSDLATLAADGDTIEGVRAYLHRWGATADATFTETFRSEAFVRVQARLINSGMRFRVCQNRLNDRVMQLYGLPTRQEVDEAHRRIQELRRDVKALRRQIASDET
jgi:class III poly(R)-hydroxyalkanoic acid synthase PhaE subunit